MSKSMYIVGVLLIAGFAVLGAREMINAQMPYAMTVAEVRSAGDRPVQFMGSILRGRARYDEKTDELSFVLSDKDGNKLTVRYHGVEPAGFDNADKAVVRGVYNGGELAADQVLLKCPSKYRGR